MSERLAVKSASRVLDLFELLGRWGREMSHTEIAAALKIPKSSLTQLLANLVDRGYVEFVSETKGYRLGQALTTLVARIGRDKTLYDVAMPVLAEITRQTGESSALNVLQGDCNSKVVISASSPQRLVSHMRTGDLAPLHSTSGGKVILANLPEADQARYLAHVRLEPITKSTITSVADLRRQLRAIRRDGVAFAFGEFTQGIVGIAVPILSEADEPIGSINIAMPAVRYDAKVRDRAVPILQQAASTLRWQLGIAEAPRRKPRARS